MTSDEHAESPIHKPPAAATAPAAADTTAAAPTASTPTAAAPTVETPTAAAPTAAAPSAAAPTAAAPSAAAPSAAAPSAAAPTAGAPIAGAPAATTAPAGPGRWRSWFDSPLRAALVAIAATLVLVAGPCVIGAFVLGAAVGSGGWNHDDGPRMERGGDRPGRVGPRPDFGPRFDDRRVPRPPGVVPPTVVPPTVVPPTVVPPTAVPSPSVSS